MKITLDTNCFFEYFERDPELIKELICFQEQGQIDITMTTRVMADTFDKWKGQGVSPIWKKIQTFPLLEVVGTGFRLDMSRLDSGDYLVPDSDIAFLERLHNVIADAQLEDLDHLYGHIRANRDIFVTNDRHFLKHQEQLKQEFNMLVFNPIDTIQYIRDTISEKSDFGEATQPESD